MVNIRWLGTAALEITCQGETVLIDPYLSRVSKWQTLTRPLRPETARIRDYLRSLESKVSGVLVGHTHSDHVLDVPIIIDHTEALAYGSSSLRTLMSAYELENRARVVEPGARYRLGPFRAVPLASRHGRVFMGKVPFPGEIEQGLVPPLRVNKYREGTTLLWHLTVAGRRYLHMGSANYIAEEIRGTEVDVLFLCAVGCERIPNFTRDLLQLITPKVVVPFHFDDISVPLNKNSPPRHVPGVRLDRCVDEIKGAAPGVEVIVPHPYAVMDL